MARMRFAFLSFIVAALVLVTTSATLIALHREGVRMHAEWKAQVERHRAQFSRVATRAEVEAALHGSRVGWQSFSGGMIEPGESTFQDSAPLGTRANRLCRTVIHARANIVYRTDAAAEVITDRPNDTLHRIYLEEVDPCGAL